MRFLFVALTLLGIACAYSVDPAYDFDQRYLVGEWIRVTEQQSSIGGLYYKDTTFYLIGTEDSIIPDTVPAYKKPLSFVIEYYTGAPYYGYILDPRNEDYDENGVPYITYTWVELIRPSIVDITLARSADDSMTVYFGSQTFGLKKVR